MRKQLSNSEVFHAADGKIAIQTVADVSRDLGRATAIRNARQDFNPGDGFTLAASIPMPVVAQFANERGISIHEVMNDDGLLAQLLAWAPKFKTIDKSVF